MFLDVTGNTKNIDIMLFVEVWAFNAEKFLLTFVLIVCLVIAYARLSRYAA